MAVVQVGALGVPVLRDSTSIVIPELLSADSLSDYGALATKSWGVFLQGAPVVLFDTFVSIDYRRGWALSDYPVERGAFETYNKVQLPYDVRVRFASGGSEANRTALLSSVEAVSKTLLLYDVVTPEKVFTSVNVQHIDFHRTATNGVGLITVEMWLLQVRVTANNATDLNSGDFGSTDGNPNTGTGNVSVGDPILNPTDPSGADPTNNGNVSPNDSHGAGGGGGGGF